MSVHDVAAVDRVNSLRRTPAPTRPSSSSSSSGRLTTPAPFSSPMSPNMSLPTSPTRDPKTSSESLRRAMARHQASLSRPESPQNMNDDIPSPKLQNDPHGSMVRGSNSFNAGLIRRRERDNRYKVVSSTGYRPFPATGENLQSLGRNKDNPGFEETKASLRNSQIFLDDMSYDSKSLPKQDASSGDDLPELSNKKYPYLSTSTYSLPRNHRINHSKSSRQFASTLRESQESLLSSSREHLYPESRETILNRYPSQSPRTPRRCLPDDDIPAERQFFQSEASRRNAPSMIHENKSYYDAPEYHYHHQPQQMYHEYEPPPPSPYYQHPHSNRGYGGYNDYNAYGGGGGYYSDYDYRRSVPVSPATSMRSSRAGSPTRSGSRPTSPHHPRRRGNSPTNSVYSTRSYSRRSSPTATPTLSRRSSRANSPHEKPRVPDYYETQEYIRKASIRLRDITTPSPSSSRVSSRVSSARSSRAASPSSSRHANSDLENILMVAKNQADPKSKIVFVRETFQVIPSTETDNSDATSRNMNENLPMLKNHNLVKINTEETQMLVGAPFGDVNPKMQHNTKKSPSEERIKVIDDNKSDTVFCDKPGKVDIGVNTDTEDDFEERTSVITQGSASSSRVDKGILVDLSKAGITNIEEMLESLSRRVRNVETMEKDLVDNDDSARAESVASMVSSTSSKGKEKKKDAVADKEAHSMIRRQSVIIEGLTLETDELRRRCQMLEDEIDSVQVDDLQQKLDKVEGKLEETENYCYQVVEENVELKSEIENLETEISEVQDTFRDKDAKEFKKTKWELENLAKTCRNLQLKLGKAQAKASRLRQEKEEIEEQQKEQQLWKTTAVVAAAALAVLHLVNKYK